jgi:hypothetical protein
VDERELPRRREDVIQVRKQSARDARTRRVEQSRTESVSDDTVGRDSDGEKDAVTAGVRETHRQG